MCARGAQVTINIYYAARRPNENSMSKIRWVSRDILPHIINANYLTYFHRLYLTYPWLIIKIIINDFYILPKKSGCFGKCVGGPFRYQISTTINNPLLMKFWPLFEKLFGD